jgi:hypothetical protein
MSLASGPSRQRAGTVAGILDSARRTGSAEAKSSRITSREAVSVRMQEARSSGSGLSEYVG